MPGVTYCPSAKRLHVCISCVLEASGIPRPFTPDDYQTAFRALASVLSPTDPWMPVLELVLGRHRGCRHGGR